MELSYAGDARGQHAEEPSQGTNGKGNGRQVGSTRQIRKWFLVPEISTAAV